MQPVRAIVVGAGSISRSWFEALRAEGVVVPAVVDIRRDAARRRIDEFRLDAVASEDLAQILRDVPAEFLLDLTVPEAHCRVVCQALEAGLHVLGEKPLAATMDQARTMVRTAERTGRMYMIDQTRRWNTHHDALARTVAAGRLGTLTTLNCDFYIGAHFGGFRDLMDSPLVLDMAIHHFDLARMISGQDPLSVYAEEFRPSGSWYAGAAAANCLFEMTGNVRFAYRGSWCAEGCHTSWNGNWRVIGSSGTMLYENDQPPRGQLVAGESGFHRPLADLPVEPSPLEQPEMRGALREMLAFLRTGRTPQTECHDNIRSLAMVFAAMESARTGRRVPVEAFQTDAQPARPR